MDRVNPFCILLHKFLSLSVLVLTGQYVQCSQVPTLTFNHLETNEMSTIIIRLLQAHNEQEQPGSSSSS